MPYDPTYSGFGPSPTPTLLTGWNPTPAAAAPPASSLGTNLSIVGAIGSMIGSYYSAQSAKNTLKHQAKMIRINAQIAELGARSSLLQGQRQEQASRLRVAHVKSAQRVGFAANGIDIAGSDSALNVLTSTDYIGEADALTIQRNALQAAWGYRTQGMNYANQAAMSRADAGGISPGVSAATSLLGSATAIADRWYQNQQLRK